MASTLQVDGASTFGVATTDQYINIKKGNSDKHGIIRFYRESALEWSLGHASGESSDAYEITSGTEFAIWHGATAGPPSAIMVLDSNSRISLSNNDGNTNNTVFGYKAFTNNGTVLGDVGADQNVAVGDLAMGTGTTTDATYNVAIGYQALTNITDGDTNTVIGAWAGQLVSTGSNNVAIGNATLGSTGSDDVEGDNNVAIGGSALTDIDDGSDNVAIGHLCGDAITDTSNVVLIGKSAGSGINHADANGTVAVGYKALEDLEQGQYNIGIGQNALANITTSDNMIAIGDGAGKDADSAGSTPDGCVYIGPSSGQNIDDGTRNIAIGYSAMKGNTENGNTPNYSVAIGYEALKAVTDGDDNVVIGYQSGDALETGTNNVIIGTNAGTGTVDVDKTVIIGDQAGGSNLTSGADGTIAIGFKTLENLTTGGGNTAIGYQVGKSIGGGSNNTLFGYEAMGGSLASTADDSTDNVFIGTSAGGGNWVDTSGPTSSYNVGIGSASMNANMDGGSENTCVGYHSGGSMTTADTNVCIGYDAGDTLTTGYQNVILGARADAEGTGVLRSNVLGHTVIGATDTTTLGNSTNDIRATNGSTTWATVSDKRFKKNIETSTAGLSFVNDLRPVTYNWKTKGEVPEWSRAYEEGSEEQYRNAKHNHGFIAQEVKEAIDNHSEIKDGFMMWTEMEEFGGQQEVGETAIVPMLVKAIQELSSENNDLKTRIEALEAK